MKQFFESWFFTTVPTKIKPKSTAIIKPIDNEQIRDKNSMFDIYYIGHERDIDNNITNYWYIALKLQDDVAYDFDRIERLWGIKHNIIIDNNYLLFIFEKYLDSKEYNYFWEVLEFIYSKSEIIDFIPFPWTIFHSKWTQIEHNINNEEYIDKDKFNSLYSFIVRFNSQDLHKQDITRDNIEKIKTLQKFTPISSILNKLWITYNNYSLSIQDEEWWKIDEKNNIVLDLLNQWNPCWWPFFFVLQHKNSRIDETLEWFNVNFDAKLTLDETDKDVIKSTVQEEWITVIKWDWFYYNDIWYFRTWDKPYQLTNFAIKVYYTIDKLDWTKDYIIELYNPKEWKRTQQIKLLNTHSVSKIREYFSSFWWYLFYWKDNEILALIKAISSLDVPNIKNVLWLWFNDWKLMLANWIFNLSTKKLTLSEPWAKFLFDDEWKWYQVTINNWKPFFEIFNPNHIHKFNTINKVVLPSEIWNTFKNMYKWDVWLMLLMYTYWQIAYWIFKEYSDDIRYPLLLTYWLTASWKTEFIEILWRIYWASWELNNFNWITWFMFLALISTFNWLPVLFSEYREKWIKDIDAKKNKIRNLFDRKWEWKWKADQSIIAYKYIANMAMEWEETISDPATRSRSIMIHMSKKNKLDSVSDFKKLTHSPEVTNLLYTYLRWFKFDYPTYNKYFLDWQEHLKSSESRIQENFARIYAWAMLFDSTKKERYIEILTKYIEIATKDQKENQWYMALFKAIAMNIRNIYAFSDDDKPFYVPDNIKWMQYPHFFLKVDKIQEYFRIKRVPLELEFETYLDYMWDAGYDYWIHQVWTQWMMYAVKIPITKDMPKELLVIQEVYNAYKILFPNP